MSPTAKRLFTSRVAALTFVSLNLTAEFVTPLHKQLKVAVSRSASEMRETLPALLNPLERLLDAAGEDFAGIDAQSDLPQYTFNVTFACRDEEQIASGLKRLQCSLGEIAHTENSPQLAEISDSHSRVHELRSKEPLNNGGGKDCRAG
jgi:hypothetical protein